MNRNWKDHMRRLLRDNQQTAPEGLLDDIKNVMAQRGVEPVPGKCKTRIVSMQARRWAKIAASVAVVIGVGLCLLPRRLQTGLQPLAQMEIQEAVENSVSSHMPVTDMISTPHMVDGKTVAALDALEQEIKITHDSIAQSMVALVDRPNVDAKVKALSEDRTGQPEQRSTKQSDACAKGDEDRTEGVVTTQSQLMTAFSNEPMGYGSLAMQSAGRGVEVSVGLSGMPVGNVGTTTSPRYASSSDTSPYDVTDGTSSNPAVSGLSHANPITTRAKHHQPFKVGLSVRVPLGWRWCIQTGVNYACLKSEFEDANYGTGMAATQTLHYIGVPIGVGFDVLDSRRFNVYAMAGGEVEKLVNGSYTTEQTKRKVKESRPVMSVGATVGAAYKLSGWTSVYVEPGVSYHFKNGSGVKSTYTGRPLGFSLNVGIRLSIK